MPRYSPSTYQHTLTEALQPQNDSGANEGPVRSKPVLLSLDGLLPVDLREQTSPSRLERSARGHKRKCQQL